MPIPKPSFDPLLSSLQAPSHLAGRTREGENVELIVPVVVQEHDLLCGVMQILINLVGNAMKVLFLKLNSFPYASLCF